MKYKVTLVHTQGWEPRDWARESCPSYLSCTLHGIFGDGAKLFMDYHFNDEKDLTMFLLRWS